MAPVERAALEFRCGRPVFIFDKSDVVSCAVATEMVTDELLSNFNKVVDSKIPDIVFTHQRAKTLKIRLYTPDIVRVPLPDWLSVHQIQQLADPQFDLVAPMRGPFHAKRDPVPDSVSAGVKLAKISKILPSILVSRVPLERMDQTPEILKVFSEDIENYDVSIASRLEKITSAQVPLGEAENARIIAFRPLDGGIEHLAIVIGNPRPPGPILTRLHSECFTGDLLGSLKCDCGEQLIGAIKQIGSEGEGVLLYLAQEGRGIGLINKLRAYALQDQGFDTVEANQRLGFEDDERLFLAAAEMLKQLEFSQIRLLTNNPRKIDQLKGYGIKIVERVPHSFPSNTHNERYLSIKADKSGHLF